jgi:hypothetical protein
VILNWSKHCAAVRTSGLRAATSGSGFESLQSGAAILGNELGFLRDAVTDPQLSQRGRFAGLIWRCSQRVWPSALAFTRVRCCISLLWQGDTFDPLSDALRISSLPERSSLVPRDLLEPNAFTHLLEDFAQQPSTELERVIQAGKSHSVSHTCVFGSLLRSNPATSV